MKKLMTILAVALVATAAFGAQNYVRDGGTIDYTNSGADISVGDVVDLGSCYGVALGDIASNDTGVVLTQGQWKFVAATNDGSIALGQPMFLTAYNDQVTKTATADKYIGTACEAVTATTGTYVTVELNAPARSLATAFLTGVTVQRVSGYPVWTNATLTTVTGYPVLTNVTLTLQTLPGGLTNGSAVVTNASLTLQTATLANYATAITGVEKTLADFATNVTTTTANTY